MAVPCSFLALLARGQRKASRYNATMMDHGFVIQGNSDD
jgi:hypothetical protein